MFTCGPKPAPVTSTEITQEELAGSDPPENEMDEPPLRLVETVVPLQGVGAVPGNASVRPEGKVLVNAIPVSAVEFVLARETLSVLTSPMWMIDGVKA
jgi:hypothetical protein